MKKYVAVCSTANNTDIQHNIKQLLIINTIVL